MERTFLLHQKYLDFNSKTLSYIDISMILNKSIRNKIYMNLGDRNI